MSAAQTVAELRQRCWQHGFRPMAVYSFDFKEPLPPPGKKPGPPRAGKAPLGLKWQVGARKDPPEVIDLGTVVAWAQNTGILCDGLRAIDLDIDDPALVAQVCALALATLGPTIIRIRGNSPRCLLVYRAAESAPHKLAVTGASHSKDNACKIEVLGWGNQFVAYGRHPSGADLLWPDGGPADVALADVQAVTEIQVHGFLKAAAPVIGAPPPDAPRPKREHRPFTGEMTGDLFDIAAAVAVLKNDGPPDWESWNNVGLRIFAATAGSDAGLDLFLGYSAKNPAHDEDATIARWDHYKESPPDRTGAGKLFKMARKACPGWRKPSEIAAATHQTGAENSSSRTPIPPPGWESARPLLGEIKLLPPPLGGLPAFYPAPTEDTVTAKARQDAALTAHMTKAVHLIDLKREIDRVTDERTAFFDERIQPDADDVSDAAHQELSSAERGAFKKLVHREIAEREGYGKKLPPPPRHLFSGAQGTGKTTVARQFAAASTSLTTWITETTFEKSQEEYTAYLMEPGPKPPAMLVRGRARKDPMRPGHFMCDRHKATAAIARASLSVPKLLCMTCPLAKVCGDHRQRREAKALVEAGNGAVFFLAGNYAFLPAPVPKPDHAVLDESLLQMATDVRTISIAEIAALTVPNINTTGADTTTTLRGIIEAFTVPIPATPDRLAAGDDRIMVPLAFLRHAQIDKKALKYLAKAARKELGRQTPKIGAYLTDAEIEDALEGGERGLLRQLRALIEALLVEIKLPFDNAIGVWETDLHGAPAIGVARLRKLRGLKKAALTVLDGTGKVGLARKLFGKNLENTHVPFDRLAHITGTRGKSYSRQSITAEDSFGNSINHKVASAGRLRGDIATIFGRLPAGSVICASKRVEEMLFDSGAVPSDTPSMHFGDLRGRNTWEHYPGGLFVGAENIAIGAAEAMARAFMAGDTVPFVSMDHASPKGWRYEHQWPYRATRMRRMRDGTLSPVEVPVHPDPRVQDVLELVREDELLQAIDRLRAVWHRRHLVLLNDLCLDVAYDEIESHKHLAAGGNPIRRAFLATGIVPHTPELLHLAHRDIFRSPAAAEHAQRNYRRTSYKSPIWEVAVVRFRRAGQHGPEARASIDRTRWPNDAVLIAAIETFAGPLQSFQGVALRDGATPANVPPVQSNAGPTPPEPRQPGSGAAPPSVWVHGPPDG